MILLTILNVRFFALDLQTFARDVQTTESQIAGRREIDYDDEITRYIASAAPLTILTRKLAKKKTMDPEFRWFESEIVSCWDAVNNATGYDAVATVIAVDTPEIFTPFDIVKIPRTGEQVLVTAVDDVAKTITVRRGFGTTAAAPIVDNDPLFIVGNAHAEGGARAQINQGNPVEKSNYTQIFKHTFGVTRTEMDSQQRGQKELDRLRLDKLLEHNRAIEQALWFGEPKLYTSGEVRRTTGGVLHFVNAVSQDFADVVTWSEVESACELAFAEGSDTKALFAAPAAISVLDQLAGSKLQTVPSNQTYGIAVKRLVTGHGELLVIKHPLFKGAVYGYMGVVLDLKYLKYRYLSDTELQTRVEDKGADARIDQYRTECGLELKLPKCHMVWKNMKSVA